MNIAKGTYIIKIYKNLLIECFYLSVTVSETSSSVSVSTIFRRENNFYKPKIEF